MNDKKLIIKTCGMLHPDNIGSVAALTPEYMGFIFFAGSPRYVGEKLKRIDLPEGIKRVGVFVNSTRKEIGRIVTEYELDAIQLHGQEPPAYCKELRERGYEVIKAFPIEREADLLITNAYDNGNCDYFLFDTKTPKHGGSGERFDWNVLNSYTGNTPFLLSGGISPLDAEEILALKHPKLAGVDLNSRFEVEPGLKNVAMLERFIKHIRQ